MASLKQLKDLTNLINDSNLRKKTLEFLDELPISNKHFQKYKRKNLKDAPAGPETFHHGYKGGLVDHTVAVVNNCIHLAAALKETYPKIKIDMDTLISAAILHDIMKVHTFYIKKGVRHTGVTLDHGIWAAAELYARGFPENVIHCVASHGGKEINPPLTVEAVILRFADLFDSEFDVFLTEMLMREMIK